ncbi:hypothetical protein L484_010281 [Morus notabilis]|uniref:Uncharacterized protein n=1 Tax=Morus notabilis TaxID=981085 RepID=W9QN37_9ROSA|nr:hypothetical protein L484_010281 [Morus notabilis]
MAENGSSGQWTTDNEPWFTNIEQRLDGINETLHDSCVDYTRETRTHRLTTRPVRRPARGRRLRLQRRRGGRRPATSKHADLVVRHPGGTERVNLPLRALQPVNPALGGQWPIADDPVLGGRRPNMDRNAVIRTGQGVNCYFHEPPLLWVYEQWRWREDRLRRGPPTVSGDEFEPRNVFPGVGTRNLGRNQHGLYPPFKFKTIIASNSHEILPIDSHGGWIIPLVKMTIFVSVEECVLHVYRLN